MKAPKILACGHAMQCVISGVEDCQNCCAHKARQATKPVAVVPQVETTCLECGKKCFGISYCGCRGWD